MITELCSNKKRQNANDAAPRIIDKEGSKLLRYGLGISINLGLLNFESMDVDETTLKISYPKSVVVEEKNYSYEEIACGNEIEIANLKKTTKEICINIPNNFLSEEPIVIHTNTFGNEFLKIKIIIGSNSKVKIIDYKESGALGYVGRTTFIDVAKNTTLNYFSIQNHGLKKSSYEKKICTVKRDSTLNLNEFLLGSKNAVSEQISILQEEGASANLQNYFFSNENQEFDQLAEAIHKAPRTNSDLKAKGVTQNNSKSLYRGNIHITENAHNSTGFQKAEILMVDKLSQADAIPQLLIDNNEVACSHAVAIGRIDEEKLFYFMSRGISEEDAKKAIIQGMFEPEIEAIEIKKYQDIIYKKLTEKTK